MTQWAVKAIMVLERTGTASRRYFTGDERKALMDTLAVPALTKGWLGRYAGDWGLVTAGIELGAESEEDTGGVAYTLVLVRLVVQVVVVRQIDERIIRLRSRPGPWPDALLHGWPPIWSL